MGNLIDIYIQNKISNVSQNSENYNVAKTKQPNNHYQTSITKPNSLERTQSVDNFIQNNKKNIIASTIGTGLTIGLLAVGNYFLRGKNTMKLASHIDFKPAETIEEAKKFGKKFLGIKKYKNIDDLDILNWINGGLVELNNKTKGTSKMPTKITGKDINGAQAAAGNMINGGNILYINQNIIKKMINQLSTNMDILLSTEALTRKRNDGTYQLSRLLTKDGFTKKFEDLINKYKKNPNNLSFKEKILLSQSTGEIMSYVNEMFVNGSQIKQIARMNLDFPINGKKWTLEEIKKLGKDEQIKVLSELIGLNKDFKIPYSSNPYSTIFHELGHINHLKSAGRKLYVQYSTLEELKGFSTKTKEISKEFNDSLEKQAIVRDISIYSGESPAEFVAETYSRLITGDKIPDRVMKLYNSYKGPKVEI